MTLGERFGRLTVSDPTVVRGKRNERALRFKCDCGVEMVAIISRVRSGQVKSCGCLRRERMAKGHPSYSKPPRHGAPLSQLPEYSCWRGMIGRCYHKSNAGYASYGGSGISVCERWRNSFDAFLADMGPRPSRDHSIDRIHSSGNYEPGNCRWATAADQARNTSRNIMVDVGDTSLCLRDVCTLTGADYGAVRNRVNMGCTPPAAVLSVLIVERNPDVRTTPGRGPFVGASQLVNGGGA